MFKKFTFLLIFVIISFAVYFYYGTHSLKSETEPVTANPTPINSIKSFTVNETSQEELDTIITKYTQQTPATLGVGIKNLTTGEEFYYNKNLTFTAASLYKLVVMYGVYYDASLGKLDINDPTTQRQLDQMITVSSNESALALAERLTWDRLDNIAKSIGMKNTSMYRPLTTTPEDITNFLNLIEQKRALDPQSSEEMKKLLLRQTRNDRIPALLPKGTPVAHKTGELDDFLHDAGIVYGPKNTYILTLMSKGIPDQVSVKDLMARLSLDIYNHFER